MVLFEVRNLVVHYGAIEALKGISFSIEKGETVCLLGANGAGKSTIMKAILSIIPVKSGEIFFQEKALVGLPSHKIISLGLGISPEGRMIFPDMTVQENLELGAYSANLSKAQLKFQKEMVYELFPIIKQRQKQMAGTFSGGEQQMLALGRALMSKPSLLLLDEPSLGISPIVSQQIFSILKQINMEGTSILIAEQNAFMALSISHRGYVVELGQIVMSGPANQLMSDDFIRKSYLGV